jgi:hypothetical protein
MNSDVTTWTDGSNRENEPLNKFYKEFIKITDKRPAEYMESIEFSKFLRGNIFFANLKKFF